MTDHETGHETGHMTVHVNGVETELAAGATVYELVERAHGIRRGVAVAIDGEVVPRSTWADAVIEAGARVEILVAVQGG